MNHSPPAHCVHHRMFYTNHNLYCKLSKFLLCLLTKGIMKYNLKDTPKHLAQWAGCSCQAATPAKRTQCISCLAAIKCSCSPLGLPGMAGWLCRHRTGQLSHPPLPAPASLPHSVNVLGGRSNCALNLLVSLVWKSLDLSGFNVSIVWFCTVHWCQSTWLVEQESTWFGSLLHIFPGGEGRVSADRIIDTGLTLRGWMGLCSGPLARKLFSIALPCSHLPLIPPAAIPPPHLGLASYPTGSSQDAVIRGGGLGKAGSQAKPLPLPGQQPLLSLVLGSPQWASGAAFQLVLDVSLSLPPPARSTPHKRCP